MQDASQPEARPFQGCKSVLAEAPDERRCCMAGPLSGQQRTECRDRRLAAGDHR